MRIAIVNIDRSLYPRPLFHSSTLSNMDLNEDPSKYDDHLVDSSGKVAVFAKLAELSFDTSTVDRWLFIYPKWRELVKQIQTMMIIVSEDYFLRNQWFQQSVSVAVDAVGILNLNHQLQEMTESLDSVIDSFLHMESRGQTVLINDIHDVFGYGLEEDEPLEDFVRKRTLVYRINSKNEINFIRELPEDDVRKSLLLVWWNINEDKLDENLSFGADVLPVLQTLCVTQLFDSSRTHAFCHVLSRSSLAPSLSSIEIRSLLEEMKEQDFIVLDDTLAQLHDRVQISINKRYWNDLPKLQSKGVLMDIDIEEFDV
ncbi:hypothetical protein ABKN59_011663 [Abortiporus biennis]